MPSFIRRSHPTSLKRPTTRVLVTIGSGIWLIWLAPGCSRQPPGGSQSAPVSLPASGSRGTAPSGIAAAESQVRASPRNLSLRRVLADEYFSTGETFAGIEQLEAARSLSNPGAPDTGLLLELARRYDVLGEPEAAAATLNLTKSDPDLALPLAQYYLELGEFQKSADALHPLVTRWATIPVNTRQTVVQAILLSGDIESSGPLLPADSSNAEWQVLSGLHALLAAKPAQAVKYLQQAAAQNPRDAWTGYLIGKAWLASGDSKRAAQALARVALLPSPPPQALIEMAALEAHSGRLNSADALLDRVQGSDRKLPSYWIVAAQIARGRKHAAVEKIALGYAAYNEGDPWMAESIWKSAIPFASDDLNRGIHVALTNSALRREDASTALHYAAEGARLWPSDPESLREYAETLLALSQAKDALIAAQRFQAVARPEQQAQAAELLSRIALDSSNAELLKQNVQKDRALSPNDPMPLLHLAEWQGQQGRDAGNLQATLDLYQSARTAAPNNAEAAAHAGLMMADQKRTPEAISTLIHAMTLNPRVMDGAPSVLLTQLYRRLGYVEESQFEAQWYQKMRALKESWPTLLKTMRQVDPPPTARDWRALGEMALRRHETWIALCAFTRLVKENPRDPDAWGQLAAAQKRLGWFDEALSSMRRAAAVRMNRGKRARS